MRKAAVSTIAVLAAGLGFAAAPAGSATSVSVRDNFFSPRSVTISRGATVTWRWRGRASHNVVGRGLRSRTMRSGRYSKRFRSSGTYNYVCTLHRGMRGTVRVR